MREHLTNIYRLGIKELCSLRRDAALVFLIVYAFTYAIYAPARQARPKCGTPPAMVDEDGSSLSRRIRDALLPPRFQPPAPLTVQEIDAGMDTGRYTFVIDIPPDFQTDVVRGRRPAIQLNVDATAMTRPGWAPAISRASSRRNRPSSADQRQSPPHRGPRHPGAV